MKNILGLFLLTLPLLGLAQEKSNVMFAVSNENSSSIVQIVGLCDGTKSSQSLSCSLIHVSLTKGDQLKRKIMGGGENQCFLDIGSDGKKLQFTKTVENSWTARSEPSLLCGSVDTYVLESEKNSRFFKLMVSTKLTDMSMKVCEVRKSLDETSTTYSASLGALSCDGIKTGPNPGF